MTVRVLIKIIKNNSGSTQTWKGTTLAHGESVTLRREYWSIWAEDQEVVDAVISGDIIVNDGTSDLNADDGLEQLFRFHIEEAEHIVFENDDNDFVSTNVQDAIEELKANPLIAFFPQFQKIGNMNSDQYLMSYTDQVGGILSSARGGGNSSNGYRYGDSAPIACPFNGKVVSATFVIQGVAVSTGSAASQVTVNCELRNVGFTNEGNKISDLDIQIPSASYTIGNYWNASIDTNFSGSVDLDISVTKGQLLALKFDSITGNSNAVAVDNITVVLEIHKI